MSGIPYVWHIFVHDVVGALASSVNPSDYWFRMKVRVKERGGIDLSATETGDMIRAYDSQGGWAVRRIKIHPYNMGRADGSAEINVVAKSGFNRDEQDVGEF